MARGLVILFNIKDVPVGRLNLIRSHRLIAFEQRLKQSHCTILEFPGLVEAFWWRSIPCRLSSRQDGETALGASQHQNPLTNPTHMMIPKIQEWSALGATPANFVGRGLIGLVAAGSKYPLSSESSECSSGSTPQLRNLSFLPACSNYHIPGTRGLITKSQKLPEWYEKADV